MSIALPAIVANITTPLLGLVDLAITGHMGNAVFMAAIALGGTIFSMLYWAFGFLRMGTSGMTAQARGAGDDKESSAVFFRTMIVALALGALIIAARSPVRSLMLGFLGADSATSDVTARYFDILIFGAPAMLGTYALNGWFIGNQDTRLTMWMSLIINVVNIAMSLIFVYVLDLEIAGVAAGTLTAQWAGFVVGLLMSRRYKPSWQGWGAIMKVDKLKRFFSVNTDIFLRTICLVAVTVWFTRSGARQGDVILAVNALLMQLFILFSYVMDGFAYAGEALVGHAIGAGDKLMERLTVVSLFKHGAVLSLAFTVVYAVFGDDILRLLSDETDVVVASDDYRWWAVSVPFAGFASFIYDGVFIGATRTREMLLSMAASMVIFFVLYFALFQSMGNHALWLAFIAYLVARGFLLLLFYCCPRRVSHKSHSGL